jgi:phosphate starvation-inducible PhoH-like protein
MGMEFNLPSDNNRQLSNLCGALDQNLKQIEAALEVDIVRRGSNFIVNGSSKNIKAAAMLIQKFYKEAGDPIELEDIQLGLVEINKFEKTVKATAEINELKTKRSDLRGRTTRQNAYLKNIQDFDITFGIGPAGTGKTYLAVASAVDAINRDKIKRIVLVRPAVEAGERLGFLPGDLAQKVNTYLKTAQTMIKQGQQKPITLDR